MKIKNIMPVVSGAATVIGPMLIVLFIIKYALPPPKPFSDPVWELIHTPNESADMIRTRVPHGWIVTYKRPARTMLYIPDEKHEWEINSKK